MSEFTRCNFCTLQELRLRNKGKNVSVRRLKEGDMHGWLGVFIDGKEAGYWFKELGDHCEC